LFLFTSNFFKTIEVEESVIWFPSHDYLPPTLSELRRWKVEGNKKLSIDDETNFCDAKVLLQVLECKVITNLKSNFVPIYHSFQLFDTFLFDLPISI